MFNIALITNTLATPSHGQLQSLPTLWWAALGLPILLELFWATMAYREMLIRRKLKRDGTLVHGRITSRRVAQGRGINYSYVTYSYVCNMMTYAREQLVSRKHYEAWHEGVSVAVTCLPERPKTARIVSDNAKGRGLILLAIWTLVVPIFLA